MNKKDNAQTEETDNSTDSQTEETNTDQTQTDEEDNSSEENKNGSDKGFADDPRWQERENDWKERFNEQEERHQSSLKTLRVELEEKFTPKKETNTQVPNWFGGDEDAWVQYQDHEKQKEEAIRQGVLKEIEGKTSQEQKKIEEATKYMNTQITEIEQDKTFNPNNAKIDKNKLLKYVLDNELVDTKGNWNYKAAFRLMKAEGKIPIKNMTDRKNLAGNTFDRGASDNPNLVKPITSDDFKTGERPW